MSKRSAQRKRHEERMRREQDNERAFEHAVAFQRDLGNGHVVSVSADMPAAAPVLADESAVVHAVGEVVERAANVPQSQQPRFDGGTDARAVFQSTYRLVKIALLQEMPQSNAPVRQWDEWYRSIVKAEPFLLGVYNSVVQIDKNRGWTLTGGRNQVSRFTPVLKFADEGAGWRAYADWQAQSYYFAQAGFVTECGRDGDGGPLRALWSVDPVRIELTGDRAQPLKYIPPQGNPQFWQPQDYFRGASLISTDETKRGYGYPAVPRCLELARIMIGVYELYAEATLTKEPNGIITGKNISEDMWKTALASYDETLLSKNRMFGKLMTLMSSGDDAPEFAINLFRRLPEGFDLNAWTNLLMYGYALEFGYDPREFFPVSGGQLGTAKETEAQHRKATSKGDRDFSLAHQDQLQAQLPETLLFEYEQRDVEGETADAVAAKAKAELITEINQWTVDGRSVFSADQIMQLAARHGIIPEEWTPQEEDVVATDTDPEGIERVRASERIRRAALQNPQEPIVRYHFPTMRMQTLFASGEEMLAPRVFPIKQVEARVGDAAQAPFPTMRKQVSERSIADATSRFRDEFSQAVRDTFAKGKRPNYPALLKRLKTIVSDGVQNAYFEGLKEGGIAAEDFTEDDAQAVDDLIAAQWQHLDDFVLAVQDARGDDGLEAAILDRVDLWTASVKAAGDAGRMAAKKNEMLTLVGADGESSCRDCKRLKGQRHRANWWQSHGLVPSPGNPNYECGNWTDRCHHYLANDAGERFSGVA